MKNIRGNLIENSGAGICVDGDAIVHGNIIDEVKTGIVVGSNFNGVVSENKISRASEVGILVKENNPYDFFGIPTDIDKSQLLELFKKLDQSTEDKQHQIAQESKLARFDQFTSIIERLDNFRKEYGPYLVVTFGPYLAEYLK
ncbi:hypothetical protein OHW90_02335 [Acinetobacter baumannii]|nr:hypothetical protein [Acinetobacter baumannii]